jgi:hypothetical protein
MAAAKIAAQLGVARHLVDDFDILVIVARRKMKPLRIAGRAVAHLEAQEIDLVELAAGGAIIGDRRRVGLHQGTEIIEKLMPDVWLPLPLCGRYSCRPRS